MVRRLERRDRIAQRGALCAQRLRLLRLRLAHRVVRKVVVREHCSQPRQLESQVLHLCLQLGGHLVVLPHVRGA